MNERGYDEKYDCFYDLDTGEWLEEKCIDPNCEYCANRPPKHLEEPIGKINLHS